MHYPLPLSTLTMFTHQLTLIQFHHKCYPFFKDVIGEIDGTHITFAITHHFSMELLSNCEPMLITGI